MGRFITAEAIASADKVCLAEVSLKQSFECFSVSCFIASHLVYCVVDCIQVSSFRSLCKIEFTFCIGDGNLL